MDYESKIPLSRLQIRKISKFTRRLLDIKTIIFPVLKELEKLIDRFPNNLYYCVLPDDSFETNVMAKLVQEGNNLYCIKIRESVYDGAVNGDKPCLDFICHEICHFVLIHIFGAGPVTHTNEYGIVYARSFKENELPRYKSMEWQAKALCGEIMIPYEECKNYSFEEIVRETKSSDKQTRYFLRWVAKK